MNKMTHELLNRLNYEAVTTTKALNLLEIREVRPGWIKITGDKNSLGLKALDWVTPGQRVSRPKTLQGGTHVAVVCMVNELFLVSLP